MKHFKNHIDDFLFTAGVAALSTGGFFISISAGLFILGACMIAGAFIVGRAR